MHPAKTSGFYYHEKGEEGISEYSHCAPTASKQEALRSAGATFLRTMTGLEPAWLKRQGWWEPATEKQWG